MQESFAYICKPIIPTAFRRLWEEIIHNKNITGLGYNKDILDVCVHIPNFSKPIQLCSVGFLDGVVP